MTKKVNFIKHFLDFWGQWKAWCFTVIHFIHSRVFWPHLYTSLRRLLLRTFSIQYDTERGDLIFLMEIHFVRVWQIYLLYSYFNPKFAICSVGILHKHSDEWISKYNSTNSQSKIMIPPVRYEPTLGHPVFIRITFKPNAMLEC